MYDNYQAVVNGRIWLVWDPQWCEVRMVRDEAQIFHCEITSKIGDIKCYLTIVYGFNAVEHMRALWENLKDVAMGVNKPWLIAGDFNAVMYQDDRMFGNPITYTEVKEYSKCMRELLLTEVQWRGDYYTWSNKQLNNDRINSRLDKAFGNHEWMMTWGHLIMQYDEPFISDHAPMLLTIVSSNSSIKVPFKIFNIWAEHKEFLEITCLQKKELIQSLEKWSSGEESALQQKAKARWIKLGDSNNKYFLALIKERTQRKKITELTSLTNRKLVEPEEIREEIVNFYKGLMGSTAYVLPAVKKQTIRKGPCITQQQRLCAEVTEKEIYDGLSSIGNDKSPGVDGYNAYFFKQVWTM
ncbi:PREDICTED: uncharacterized protein LOC109240279 [Nicotiana attenuata]|uniref:uncharacterized protein LOC109240279 n=1 Tax=Nicotiana attenuata TaxID=49451 RepID=UPI000904C0BC|nr:PREDICTED: uncharacterized protein LOC109240279 [Nicotiana attenuata]